MAHKQKQNAQETDRLVRVGTLSLGLLAPFITAIATRVRDRFAAEEAVTALQKAEKEKFERAYAAAQEDTSPVTVRLDLQDKLQTLGATISDILSDLREKPETQEVARRRDNFTDEVKNRATEFSQEFVKRSQQARKDLAEQDRNFWVAFGFGVGIAAAGIVTYVLVRRRLQEQEGVSSEPPIELPYAGRDTFAASSTERPRGEIVSIKGTERAAAPITFPTPIAVAEQVPESSKADKPTDAVLVGNVVTRHYYPIETPVEQLSVDDQPANIVYFSSEEDAKAQGYSKAEV